MIPDQYFETLSTEELRALFMVIKLTSGNPMLLEANQAENNILNILRRIFEGLSNNVTGDL